MAIQNDLSGVLRNYPRCHKHTSDKHTLLIPGDLVIAHTECGGRWWPPCSCPGMAVVTCVGATKLHHEIVDDAVEMDAVVEARVHQVDKI